MESLFAKLVLGHLLGDYILQSKYMAIMKSGKSIKGFLMCIFHCLIYAISICLFLWKFSLLMFSFVFLSHFFIDRWSLGEKWLKLIKGRNILSAYASKDQYHEIDLIFSCIVYTVTDNALHLIIMWAVISKIL